MAGRKQASRTVRFPRGKLQAVREVLSEAEIFARLCLERQQDGGLGREVVIRLVHDLEAGVSAVDEALGPEG